MEDNKKYYTPLKEDIRDGYEYEFHGMTTGGLVIMDFAKETAETVKEPHIEVWSKEVCGDYMTNPLDLSIREYKSVLECLKNGQVRTAYLNKEDLIRDGWNIIDTPRISVDRFLLAEKGNYMMKINLMNKIPFIEIVARDVTLFSDRTLWPELFGVYTNCPSINELRTIIKTIDYGQ